MCAPFFIMARIGNIAAVSAAEHCLEQCVSTMAPIHAASPAKRQSLYPQRYAESEDVRKIRVMSDVRSA
jgi:hypothetical protein